MEITFKILFSSARGVEKFGDSWR